MRKLFITIFILILLLPVFSHNYLLPVDILKTLPSFSQNSWERPKNSLLGDPVFQFEPWRHFAKEQIKNGSFPLWNDLNAVKTPFFANPQTAVLFPLNFFYYLFGARYASYVIPLLKLYLILLFSYLYLRSLRCQKPVSFLGAIAMTFSAFPIVWLLWPQTNEFLFFPLLLYITEKIHERKTFEYRWYVFLSISYFLAVLGGHPETLFHITVIHFAYILFRLCKDKKKILQTFFFIFFGFVLGSIQISPFLAYLLQSYTLQTRVHSPTSNLPIKSLIFYIFPFFLGAPHLEFYRSIAPSTNFQETIGGYTGIIIISFSLIGFIKFYKLRIIQFWAVIAFMCFAIVYKIFPFWLIGNLSVLRSIANDRLTAFIAFGSVVIFTLSLQECVNKNYFFAFRKKIIAASLLLLIICASIFLFPIFFYLSLQKKITDFLPFLQLHIIYILFTTAAFYLILGLRKKIERPILFIVSLLILSQTLFLFWNYNPQVNQVNYYPKTPLINKLKSVSSGTILEVGNPSLPPNINLMYNLSLAENDDALEFKDYKNAFDKAFPIKNQWKKIDEVNTTSLNEFGIRYIISDYDIRLQKQKVQTKYEKILNPLINHAITIPFTASGEKLEQVRFLTANFNRKNTCLLSVFLKDAADANIAQSHINCSDIRDLMFYTASLTASVESGNTYKIVVMPENATQNNSVALWGNNTGTPYVELLYNSSQKVNLSLLFSENNLMFFENQSAAQKVINSIGIAYIPETFLLGFFLSLLGAIILLIYFLRNEKNKWDKNKHWLHMRKSVVNTSWADHAIIFFLSAVTAIISYVLIVKLFHPNFSIPSTTAINWYTVHHYPRQQDYFYFVTAFSYIIIVSILLWGVYIWKKDKK